jgi:hypothetical protein
MNAITRRPVSLLAILLFILPVLFVEADSQQQKPLPQAVVDSNVYDFGNVFKGEIITHTFRINNIGDWALEVSDTRKVIGAARPAMFHSADASIESAPVLASLAAPS